MERENFRILEDSMLSARGPSDRDDNEGGFGTGHSYPNPTLFIQNNSHPYPI